MALGTGPKPSVTKKLAPRKKKQDTVAQEVISARELITEKELENTKQSLIEQEAELVIRGILEPEARDQLKKVLMKDYNSIVKNNEKVAEYIVSETVGTGVVEEILAEDPDVTDIGFNGTEFIIETNSSKQKFDSSFKVTNKYVERVINKFVHANGKDFTSKNPIFDGRFQNMRINAVHSQNTAPESGATMALRVVRPKLALTKDNFGGFAPHFMYDFFRIAALIQANMVISGPTGTGKTELHKLIAGFIPFDDRIVLIEDTPETFMKEMFKDKDIFSWVTSQGVDVTDMIKAGLRAHPVWMMVTETRGKEAYEMMNAVLSGHSIITSLHAVEARAIPARFVNMSKMGYTVEEDELIENIRRYFNFGIHIRKIKYHGHVIRYLSEIVEFDPSGDKTLFKQKFIDGVFYYETGELSESFKESMAERLLELDFPENFKAKRPLDIDEDWTTFHTAIPIDETGRPDMEKIREAGTTLDILMGREKPHFDQKKQKSSVIDDYVDDTGYITRDSGQKAPAMNAIDQAKKNLSKKPVKKEKPKVEPIVDPSINDDVNAILEKVGVKTQPEQKKPIVRPAPPKKPIKTVDEIVNEKRKQIKDRRV